MTTYTKQVADVYFDDDESTYRAVVEYFSDDHSKPPVSVPVDFRGEAGFTFEKIRELAFNAAAETLATLK